jgi:hypothetical protein
MDKGDIHELSSSLLEGQVKDPRREREMVNLRIHTQT